MASRSTKFVWLGPGSGYSVQYFSGLHNSIIETCMEKPTEDVGVQILLQKLANK